MKRIIIYWFASLFNLSQWASRV